MSSLYTLTVQTVRIKAVQEFYDTEAKYIDYLALSIKVVNTELPKSLTGAQLFMERFLEEASKPDPIITPMDVKNVFSTIPVIHNYSTALHDSLGERLNAWDNSRTKIGDIILDLVCCQPTAQLTLRSRITF